MADSTISDIEKPEALPETTPQSNSSRSSAEHSHDSEASASSFKPGWRLYMAFLSLCVITLMAAVDATSISVALPIMAKLLKGTAIEAFWAGTSFLVTSTVFQPVIGNFSSIFGRKPLIFISLAFFGVGAIVAAVAKDFGVILVGRSIQGIGGGGVIALTEIVVTDLVPLRARGQWFSFISSMWALGTVIGPILGGGFAENVDWTWIFWINLPFIGIGAPLVVLFLKLNHKLGSFMEKLRRVDWIGTVLFVASSVGFLIPVTWGGVMYAWDSWRTLVPLILCGAGLVVFIIYEEWITRRGLEPMIRLSVFKNRTAAVTYLGTFIHGMILWCVLYYEPLYYEAVKNYSPILTGVALFPETFTVAPASVVTGIIITVTGKYRWATWSGWVMFTFGTGLLILMKVDTSVPAWVFLNLPAGIGAGMLFASMAMAIQASSTNEDMAWAVTMFAFLRSFGQAVGVAVGGVVFQNQLRKELEKYPLLAANAVAYSSNASGLVQVIKEMPASLEKTQLLESYTTAFHYVCIVMCALAGVAMIASFFTKALPLDRAFETDQGLRERAKAADEEKTEA